LRDVVSAGRKTDMEVGVAADAKDKGWLPKQKRLLPPGQESFCFQHSSAPIAGPRGGPAIG
jgi:hypothetical protein